MVKIKLFKGTNGVLRGFYVSGHAGYSRKGSDIVCAAVSTLVLNTINSIEAFTTEPIDVTVNEKKGTILCDFVDRKNKQPDKYAELLVKSMIMGLVDIERNYGDYISIMEEAPND